jgi:hypothetical protein
LELLWAPEGKVTPAGRSVAELAEIEMYESLLWILSLDS